MGEVLSDILLCDLCTHELLGTGYRRNRFDGRYVPFEKYGCAAVNIKPIKPHKIPLSILDKEDQYQRICPSYEPMKGE